MRWGAAVGIVLAVGAWGRHGGVEEKAKATAHAEAKAEEAKAEEAEVAIGFVAAVDEEAHAVAVDGDLEIYVVHAAREGRRAPIVFLTGSCTHPLTYVKAFRHAAAEHGG